jgi:hypothetical protein
MEVLMSNPRQRYQFLLWVWLASATVATFVALAHALYRAHLLF